MSTAQSTILPIVGPLKSVRRRIRFIAAAHGLFRTLWITLLMVLAEGLLDYVVGLPGLLRMIIGMCIAGYGTYSLVRYAVRPLVVPVSLDTIAAQLEKLNPGLQDRLRSSLVFAGGSVPGSQAMQDAVVQEALTSMRSVDLSAATDSRPLRRALTLFAPVLGLTILLILWQPALTRIGLDRLVWPMGPIQWPRTVQIRLLNPLPRQLPAGQRLQFSIRLDKGDRQDRKVIVSWQVPGQGVQRQLAQRMADGTYASAMDIRVNEQASMPVMQLWIEAGDDTLGPVPIELIPRLQVTKVQLQATPPAYCGVQPSSYDLRVQSATVPAGSALSLSLAFNRNARNIRIEPVSGSENAGLPQIQWAAPDPRSASGQWQAAQTLRFRVRAEDESGYGNPAAEEYEVIVRPDQMPVIQLESPRRSEDRTAEATLPLEASVEDDYGIDHLVLEARLLSAGDTPTTAPAATTQPVALDLISGGTPVAAQAGFAPVATESQRHRFRLAYPWKLVSFPSAILKPGDVIEFQLAVQDTFDLNGQRHAMVRTPPLRITIVSQEQLLQHAYDDLRQIASQLGELKNRQDRLRNDTAQLREDTANKKAMEPADEAVAARISDQQSRAAAQAKDTVSRLNEVGKQLKENASPNADLQQSIQNTSALVDQASEKSMKPAATGAKQSSDRTLPTEGRNAKLDDTAKLQQQASEQLSQAIDQLGDLGGLQRATDIIQSLLDQQRKLSQESGQFARNHAGQQASDLKKDDKQKLDDLANQQGELGKQSEKAIEQLQTMADRQTTSDPTSSKAMSQASQTGKTQSVPQHQQNASSAISQNQSSQASSSQQSAEAGLQEMLNSLRDAQQHKLEELLKKLASMEEQVQLLVRRQAGHNLDSVALQELAAKPEMAGLVKSLLEKSRRQQAVASGDAAQLTASQQQTHRNATDLSADLDKVKGSAGPAAHLNRAAGRMERAVAMLKHNELQNAFAPPQMEALQELELALSQIADLRRKAQDDTKRKKQDELRQAYEEVRQQQKQARSATELLDGALAAGQKKRSDQIRLQQLAADQKKLGEKVQSLAPGLAELGSVVFNQVNRAVATDMDRVSTSISEQKTGKPTQLRQGQIVARLDAIIRGLTPPTPEDSKYAAHSGAGGGGSSGGSKRKLPPAAELQLLKDLQTLVNSGTQASKPEDTETLPDLAQQQGGIRSSLDELVKKVVEDAKLPDAAQSREPVPEESEDPAKAQVDDFDQELLTGAEAPKGLDTKSDKMPDIKLLARRMSRSQVRLGEQKDPGQVTQLVQKKILDSLDRLIDEAGKNQQQQPQSQSEAQQQAKADPNAKPQPQDDAQANANKGQTPAAQSQVRPGAKPPTPAGDIRETAKDWAGISQRDRQAIIESADENIVEKYRTLTEDYYRALSLKAVENR